MGQCPEMAQGGSPTLHQLLNAFATFPPDRIVGQGEAVGSGEGRPGANAGRRLPAGGGSRVHALTLVPTEARRETRTPARHLALMVLALDGEGGDDG